MENVEAADLKRPDAVAFFKLCIENAYEPIEDYRVGKTMDHFLEDFSRKSGAEVVDYNREWDTELKKAERAAGELPAKWKAHLYLKKLKMSTDHVSRLLGAAHGKYETEALKAEAVRIFQTPSCLRRSSCARCSRCRTSRASTLDQTLTNSLPRSAQCDETWRESSCTPAA